MMKAAIFDMDGTLLDSMGHWRSLNSAYVREMGITPTVEQERAMSQLSGMLVVSYFKEAFGIQADFASLFERSCRKMEPIYAAGIAHKPGAKAYLERLKARGVKVVLATASPAKLALIGLNQSRLMPYFDYVFSAEIIGLPKHDPVFYDALCALIGEQPRDCVMFEDALYAMRGARAAGLGVIGITDPTSEAVRSEIREVCDRLIDSYDELE